MEGLCAAMGNPGWAEDPRFATFLGRKENEDDLEQAPGEWTKDYTDRELMALLQSFGVPASVVETCEDLIENRPAAQGTPALPPPAPQGDGDEGLECAGVHPFKDTE